jgi:phage FluMu protein Com
MVSVRCPYCKTVFDTPEKDNADILREPASEDVAVLHNLSISGSVDILKRKKTVQCPNCGKFVEY